VIENFSAAEELAPTRCDKNVIDVGGGPGGRLVSTLRADGKNSGGRIFDSCLRYYPQKETLVWASRNKLQTKRNTSLGEWKLFAGEKKRFPDAIGSVDALTSHLKI